MEAEYGHWFLSNFHDIPLSQARSRWEQGEYQDLVGSLPDPMPLPKSRFFPAQRDAGLEAMAPELAAVDSLSSCSTELSAKVPGEQGSYVGEETPALDDASARSSCPQLTRAATLPSRWGTRVGGLRAHDEERPEARAAAAEPQSCSAAEECASRAASEALAADGARRAALEEPRGEEGSRAPSTPSGCSEPLVAEELEGPSAPAEDAEEEDSADAQEGGPSEAAGGAQSPSRGSKSPSKLQRMLEGLAPLEDAPNEEQDGENDEGDEESELYDAAGVRIVDGSDDEDHAMMAYHRVRSINWNMSTRERLSIVTRQATCTDDDINTKIDRVFGSESFWEQVLLDMEVGPLGMARMNAALNRSEQADTVCSIFRVQTPRQFPGVQYRKSKDMDDRCHHFAQRGALVGGILEDQGVWLRVGKHYLPVLVDSMTVLLPVDPDTLEEEDLVNAAATLWPQCCSPPQQRRRSIMMELPADASPGASSYSPLSPASPASPATGRHTG